MLTLIAKEFQQCLIELTFLEVYVNLMFTEFVEHKANLFVVIFLSLKDQDVIKLNNDEYFYEVSKYIIDP